MFSNTPRMGVPLHSQTSGIVGPTTYIICKCDNGLVNKIPFCSSDQRKVDVTKAYCDAYYSLPSFVQDVKGGNSPRFRSERFKYGISKLPGPLDYSPKIPQCHTSARRSGKGKLYVCKVPYNLKASAPSIPTKLHENGYFVDKDKNILRIPPNEHDTTLGPAFYRIKEPFVDNRYHGCMWSMRTAKRATSEPKCGPGPGEYDTQMPNCRIDERAEEARQMARLLCFVPRYLDAQEMRILRENLPGPGQYDVQMPTCKRCRGLRPKPFICGSQRFKARVSSNPSPADYQLAPSIRDFRSERVTPFASSAKRFPQSDTNPFLGPASYTIKSPLNEKLNRKKQFALIRPPFNTTTFRDTLHLKRDVGSTPSPADYLVERKIRCKLDFSSVFTSKVKRFSKRLSCPEIQRSPASYNVIQADQFIKNHQSFNSSKVPFMAAADKKGMMDDLNFENPGPAKYSLLGGLSSRGYFIPISGRFSDSDDGIPGPGSYYIHPSQGVSIYKAYNTNNLVIKEGLYRRKLRKHPRETWEKWASLVKKKKKLKCFYGISD